MRLATAGEVEALLKKMAVLAEAVGVRWGMDVVLRGILMTVSFMK